MTRSAVDAHRPRGRRWGRGSRAAVGLLCTLSLITAGCGGGDDDDSAARTSTAADASAETGAAAATTDPTAASDTVDASETTAASENAEAEAAETTTAESDLLAPQPLAERASVTYAISAPIETYLNFLLAEELGEFEKENVDVTIEFVPAADQPLLLDQGEVDAIGNTMTAGMLNLIAGGSPIRTVSAHLAPSPEAKEGFWIRNEELGEDGEFQPEDLVGKSISTVFGAASAGAISYLIYAANQDAPGVLNANNLNHTVLPLVDGVTALENGAVPVAMAVSPFSQSLEASGCCFYVGYWPDYPAGVTYFGDRLLNEEPEVGEAIIRAMARTVRDHLLVDYHRDPELSETIATVLQQPLDVFRASFTPDWTQMPLTDRYLEILQPYLFEHDGGSLIQYDEPLQIEQVYDHRYDDILDIG